MAGISPSSSGGLGMNTATTGLNPTTNATAPMPCSTTMNTGEGMNIDNKKTRAWAGFVRLLAVTCFMALVAIPALAQAPPLAPTISRVVPGIQMYNGSIEYGFVYAAARVVWVANPGGPRATSWTIEYCVTLAGCRESANWRAAICRSDDRPGTCTIENAQLASGPEYTFRVAGRNASGLGKFAQAKKNMATQANVRVNANNGGSCGRSNPPTVSWTLYPGGTPTTLRYQQWCFDVNLPFGFQTFGISLNGRSCTGSPYAIPKYIYAGGVPGFFGDIPAYAANMCP